MNIYLAWTLTVLGWICWPIGIVVYYLAIAVLTVLKLLYQPVAFVLQPVVHVIKFFLTCVAFPFKLLAKLEPLYNYLGVAVIVGLLGGFALAYIYTAVYGWLGLQTGPSQEPRVPRTVKKYREDKAQLKARSEPPILSPRFLQADDGFTKGNSRASNKSLLAQTIIEEGDSDY